MFVSVRMQFHNHVDTQPVKRFERAMQNIYDIRFCMLQVRKNEISLRKCSVGSAQLRTPEGHWSPGSLGDLVTTTLNLNRKLVYLRPQKKIEIFERHMSSKAFFYFPNVRMRMNVFCEEAIADDKVKES